MLREREREREKHFVEMATGTRRSKRNKKNPTHPVKRTNSSSTKEGDKEEEAELLVADKKSVSSKKSITSPRGKALNRSNKASFDDVVQIELLNFLEGELGGGRDTLAARRKGVPHLLDSIVAAGGAELVGKPVSKLWKVADNKFRYWLKLSESDYLDLLEHLKVTPFKYRKHKSCDIGSASAKKVP